MAPSKSTKKKAKLPANKFALTEAHPNQKHIVVAICVVLVLACLAIYGQTLSHKFLNYDDKLYVTDNTHVQSGLNLQSIGWAFTTEKALYFHPLTWMSLMLDSNLYGMHPWGFHLTNLIFHAAASVLLFLALRLLTGSLWPSAAVAALFAIHPLNVESVAWIAERKGVLSTFFWVMALGAYGWYGRRGGVGRYIAVAVAFVLGLMSKPMVVTLPFVLLLLDYWPLERVDRAATFGAMARETSRLAMEKAPLFLLAVLSCASTFVMQSRGKNIDFGVKISFAGRCANALVVYVLYLAKTVWPSGLAAFYPHPGMRPMWQVAGAAAILAAITLVCLREARRRPYLIVGWFWYLGTLVPVIGFVGIGDFSHADRYTYIPLIGIFIMVVWGMADLAAACHAPRRAVAFVSGTVLILFTVCAVVQAGYWRDSGTLFLHAIAVGQESSAAFNNAGQAAIDQKRYDEARHYLTKALDLNPGYVNALNNMGALAMDLGRNDEARLWLKKTLELQPDHVNALNNLVVIDMNQGRCDEAKAYLAKALILDPDSVSILNNIGGCSMNLGQYEEARGYFNKILELDPHCVPAMNNMGGALAKLGRQAEADGYFKRAAELDPVGTVAR